MMNRKKITVVEYGSDTGLFRTRNSVLLLLLLQSDRYFFIYGNTCVELKNI